MDHRCIPKFNNLPRIDVVLTRCVHTSYRPVYMFFSTLKRLTSVLQVSSDIWRYKWNIWNRVSVLSTTMDDVYTAVSRAGGRVCGEAAGVVTNILLFSTRINSIAGMYAAYVYYELRRHWSIQHGSEGSDHGELGLGLWRGYTFLHLFLAAQFVIL